MSQYQSGRTFAQPVLSSWLEALAYAQYRMPATAAAVAASLRSAAQQLPDFKPSTHTDLGGGTGAAVWAAADVFAAIPSTTVVDYSEPALALGEDLARRSTYTSVNTAMWQRQDVTLSAALLPVDLMTLSYVLNEVSPADVPAIVRSAAVAAQVLVVVEPGTPAGFRRVIMARQEMLAQGMNIAAPCPHDGACPMVDMSGEWCHFVARLERSTLHRQVKAASLGHEDEKFAFVVGSRRRVAQVAHRILRHPQHRKGLVTLTLCSPPSAVEVRTISRRQTEQYRAARRTSWGDPWSD